MVIGALEKLKEAVQYIGIICPAPHAMQARVAASSPPIFVQEYKILTDYKEAN